MAKIILFNKPYNVLCQFSGEETDITLAKYIPIPDFYAAGRLDKNSEGLLLLSNNGRLQHRLCHPRNRKKKYYWVQVEGQPTEAKLLALQQGITIANISYLPAEVRIISEPKQLWQRTPPIRFRQSIPTTWLEIVICEGKNHQIRKMTAAIGFPTLRLIRHRIDNWSLGSLLPGEYCLIDA